LPAGYQGAAYTAVTLAATGGTGAPYTWTVTVGASGLSAAGMSLSSAGVLSGTPTTSGAINFTAQATDSSGLNVGSLAFSLNVVAKLAITTAALPGGTLNVAYSQTLLATGGTGPYTWSTDSTGTSSLAAVGLTLSGAGLVSGATPSLGTASFTATVTDSASHTAALPFTIAITNALTISTSSLPAAYTGTAYSQTLSAAGGSGSGYTFSVAGTSNLATFNLSLSSAGLISGTPATTGTASFTAKVTDSANNTYQAPFTIQVYNPVTLPAPNPTTLGPATVSSPYSGTIVAAGGSGTGYTWTVTGLPSDGLTSSSSGATLTISGTPTSATTVTFGASVQDSLGNMAGPFTYSIVASNPAPLTLPTPNPTSLGSATANQIYSGSISLSGGASPYIWSINGTPVPTNGTALPLSDGLSATNTGGSTLSISGTPTTTGTVTLTSVTVKDNANTTAGPDTYTIAVNSASSQVSGQIYLLNSCGTIAALPQMTVQINTSPVQQTTTDNNGNYSFASVPNGTYTITPSITGASSVFYPATLTGVVVDNANVSGQTFNVALGYSVSGNVTYAGTNTGQVYLNLVNTSCGGSGGEGTSISKATLGSGGAFTVNGVAPGSYTLEAWTDPATLAEGAQNITDPTGTASVSVTSANVTGTAVTLADPTLSAPTNLPKLKSIEPANLGVIISFGGGSVSNNSGIEVFTSYTVEASTTSSFTSPITATYKAIGPKSNVWIVGNGVTGITGGTFSNGTAYYFRVMGTSPAGNSSWAYWAGPGVACITSSCAVTATVGAPTTGNAVTGIVVIPSGITPTGPLYVGLYDQTNNIAYGQYIASPATGAAGNSFTVYVPSGTDYFEFGILDQNKNGLIDAGDVSNTQNNSSNVSVSGATDLPTITLPNANSAVITQTQFNQSTFWNGSSSQTSSNYNLNFQVREQDNLPVAVQLTAASNPNVITPVDVSNYCPGCGALQFQYYQGINGDVPQDNDTYTFHVTYSNGTSENITGTVTSVLGTSALATNLAPQENNSTTTTPTFTWTFPSSPGSYTYQFDISGSSGGTLWQVPSNNSNSNGFTNTQIPGTLTWGTDPTDGTNTPTVGSLTSGTIYTWQIVSMDSNGNAAQNSVWYQP